MKVVASAPGKIVVSGEYAVLVGAPALVAAVDRRVICTLRESTSGDWHFRTQGFAGDVRRTLDELGGERDLPRDDPAYLCAHVVRQLRLVGAYGDLPRHLDVEIDSRAGFVAGRGEPAKLGIGTSAAVCVALSAALLALCRRNADGYALAHAAHRAAQGGRGSGLDVAASWHGGLIRYETPPPRVQRLGVPTSLYVATLWSGASADTTTHVARFDDWRAGAIPPPLRRLIDAAQRVVGAITDAVAFVSELRAYANALKALDDVAALKIYGGVHSTLANLADAARVVYKPCGAGGGDLGMAFTTDADALERFVGSARAAGVDRLELTWDEHGITVGLER